MEITAKKTSTPTFVTCMSSIEVEESLLKQCSGLGEEEKGGEEEGKRGGERRRGEKEERRERGERGRKKGRKGMYTYTRCAVGVIVRT